MLIVASSADGNVFVVLPNGWYLSLQHEQEYDEYGDGARWIDSWRSKNKDDWRAAGWDSVDVFEE